MDKFFFSSKNVGKRYDDLERRTGRKYSNPRSKKLLKSLLIRSMKETYGKYGKVRKPGMTPQDLVDAMNQKSVELAFAKFREFKNKSRYDSSSLGQMEMDRESEVHGRRPARMSERARPSRGRGRPRQRGPSGMSGYDAGSGGDFAPLSQSYGATITGDPTLMQQHRMLESYGRSDKESLERAAMERGAMYEGSGMMTGPVDGGMGMPGMGMPGMGMPGMGMPGMGGPLPGLPGGGGMGPNFNQRGMPAEPNFRLDGTDSRTDKHYGPDGTPVGGYGMGGMDMMGMDPMSMGMDFGAFGGANPMGMNPMQGMQGMQGMGGMPGMNPGMSGMPGMNPGMMQGGGMNQMGMPGMNPAMMQGMQGMGGMPGMNPAMMQGGGMGGMDQMGNMNVDMSNVDFSDTGDLSSAMKQRESMRSTQDASIRQNQRGGKLNAMASPNLPDGMNNMQNPGNIDSMLAMQQYHDMMSGGNGNFSKGGVQNINSTREGDVDGTVSTTQDESGKQMLIALKDKVTEITKDIVENQSVINSYNLPLASTLTSHQLKRLIHRWKKRLIIPGITDDHKADKKHDKRHEEHHEEHHEEMDPKDTELYRKLINDRKKLLKLVQRYRSKVHHMDQEQHEEPTTEDELNHKIARASGRTPRRMVEESEEEESSESGEEESEDEAESEEERYSSDKPSDNPERQVTVKSADGSNQLSYSLGKPIVIRELELVSYRLPKYSFNINPTNNRLYFQIEGDRERCISLKRKNFTIEKLMKGLQAGFKASHVDLHIEMDHRDHVVIKHGSGKLFSIINKPNSINRVLGFIRRRYTNHHTYTSDNGYNLDADQKVFVFVNDESKPFAQLDVSKKSKLLPSVTFDPPLRTSKLDVSFSYTDQYGDELYDFEEGDIKLDFNLQLADEQQMYAVAAN